ncbi:hypothetical protein PghCCS26_37690 [Paenibacillus glycanilyticus]|uniref:Uncharacterized protein n=1 Tax=Paenibacillus glycanilyticus TaxID=126569 RepID=A0ABQ6NNF7_9BACL|nr:hypothetical protein [Paenibacillus glycanilyticus]GMK46640.1 hypothetical protein PghCCS26_37690 [Paenibacillus glycanilyticus]
MEYGNKHIYTIFGLRLASEIELPELPIDIDDSTEPDAWITFADLSEYVADWNQDKQSWADEEQVQIYVPNVAFYRVLHKHVQVMPFEGADPGRYRLYILGVCCSVLLTRRGIVFMRAGGVVIDGRAYAILDDNIAGKSTLREEFKQKGYKLLSDDIVGVSINEKTNQLTAYPSYPQQETLRYQMECFQQEPIILAGIFECASANIPRIGINPLTPLQRVKLLRNYFYLNEIMRGMCIEQWLITFATKVALAIPVYQSMRPVTNFQSSELVNQILRTARGAERILL